MKAWLQKLPVPQPVTEWVVLPLWHAIMRLSKPEVRIVTGGISFYAPADLSDADPALLAAAA